MAINTNEDILKQVNKVPNIESQLADIVSCKQYGFVADYQGTPQYDGQDGARITCTDNTAAFSKMLDDCIAKKNLKVYFPAGHYGIKAGNIIKDLTGCNLTIVGDGMGQSVIDYVKEDISHVSEGINVYVAEDRANYIARINNANNITIKDITFKATTQRDLGVFLGYAGAVWGLILDKFINLKLDKVEVSNFAYRGISITYTGSTNATETNGKVEALNCFMHDNSSTGLWVKYTKYFYITGGEYCYNGVKGDFATGYAYTASTYVDTMISKNVYVHNNYANGIDAHGCFNYIIDGCILKDNRKDISNHIWGNYRTNGRILISNTTISKGLTTEDEAWMHDIFSTAQTRGSSNLSLARGELISINSDDGNNNYLDNIEEIIIENVTILSCYNGADIVQNVYSKPVNINCSFATKLRINNCNWNLQKWSKGNTETTPSPSMLSPSYIAVGEYHFNNFTFEFLSDCFCITSVVRGCLILVPGDSAQKSKKLYMENCLFKVNNSYIIGQTGIQGTSAPEMIADPYFNINSIRNFKNVIIEMDSTPPFSLSDSRINIGNATNGQWNSYNKIIKINNNIFKYPDSICSDSHKLAYLTIASPITAGNPLAYIVLDDTAYFTCIVKATSPGIFSGEDTLIFHNESSSFSVPYIIDTDGTKITVSAGSKFTDTDGRPKIRFQLNAKASISSRILLEIAIKGIYYSAGIENIIAGSY